MSGRVLIIVRGLDSLKIHLQSDSSHLIIMKSSDIARGIQ